MPAYNSPYFCLVVVVGKRLLEPGVELAPGFVSLFSAVYTGLGFLSDYFDWSSALSSFLYTR